jgi:hypothetical protein
MKRWLALFVCMAMGVGVAAAQKERYSQSHRPDTLDYPLVIHVTAARTLKMPAPITVRQGDTNGPVEPIAVLHLNATVDGKKIELEAGASALLHPGDYRARVLTQDEKKSGWFTRTYDLLFADGTHVAFTQVAESE